MGAVAPAAIYQLWGDVQTAIPQAVLSGIVGDVAHSFGYHLSRNDLPSDDYSVILPADRLGSGANASALDVSLPPDLMLTVTGRLLAAAKAGDPRLYALREFCGTTNGTQTHPYDLSDGQDGPLDSWDSSHLWHVHLSFYREYADNYAALAPIAQVMAGVNSLDLLEQIMALDRTSADYKALVADVASAVWTKQLSYTSAAGAKLTSPAASYLIMADVNAGKAMHALTDPLGALSKLSAKVAAIAPDPVKFATDVRAAFSKLIGG